jgi:hypothetical protein
MVTGCVAASAGQSPAGPDSLAARKKAAADSGRSEQVVFEHREVDAAAHEQQLAHIPHPRVGRRRVAGVQLHTPILNSTSTRYRSAPRTQPTRDRDGRDPGRRVEGGENKNMRDDQRGRRRLLSSAEGSGSEPSSLVGRRAHPASPRSASHHGPARAAPVSGEAGVTEGQGRARPR